MSSEKGRQGRVVVISGPSGVGKSTIVKEILKKGYSNLARSISATTRPPRKGEQNGKDYYFYTAARFKEMIKRGELLEYTKAYGNYYGTPRNPLEQALSRGKVIILEIDIKGAKAVKKLGYDGFFIFILPPRVTDLKDRLIKRDSLKRQTMIRLKSARKEMAAAGIYDTCIVNDSIDQAVRELEAKLIQQRLIKPCCAKV